MNCEILQIIRIVACYYPKITTSLRRTGLIKIIKTAPLIPDSIALALAALAILALAILAILALATLVLVLAALAILALVLAVLATLALALALALAVVISR